MPSVKRFLKKVSGRQSPFNTFLGIIAFKLIAANDCQMLEQLLEILDATTVLKENFVKLRQLLTDFTLDDNETNKTKSDSWYLKKSIDALETAILCVLWHKILQRFYSTSKSL